MDKQCVLASVLEPTEKNIKKCAEEILKGGIVGMPTETVYGLAASAFNVSACEKIFQYKGRPLSDPLIVHVSSMEMAHTITQLDTETEELFTILSKHFWPGPLTIVLKANPDLIDKKLIAGGDSVGIRFPIHEIAQKFIKACGVPIAAPSANKFCHISPVNPYHVYEDFKEFPVMILNGGVCTFSMESTVIKITKEKIIMFRMGAVSPDDIKKVLYKIDKYKDFPIECLEMLYGELYSILSSKKYLGSVLQNELADSLATFIEDYFQVGLEDGSDMEIAVVLIDLYNDIEKGGVEVLNRLKKNESKNIVKYSIDFPILGNQKVTFKKIESDSDGEYAKDTGVAGFPRRTIPNWDLAT